MIQKFKNYYHLALAIIATVYFGFPGRKLKVIGVTGTDGKTTTVHIIYNILKTAGKKVAQVSTVGAVIGDKKLDTGFHVTTPNPWKMQKILKVMVDEGVEYAVLEVTSHGLDQNRVFGCNFQVAVLTNISHEHLDYHKTLNNYKNAKMKLFRSSKISVLNADDSSFNEFLKVSKGKIISYGKKDIAKIQAKNVKLTNPGFSFTCIDKTKNDPPFDIKTNLIGLYNVYNFLAAISVGKNFGIKDDILIKGIETFTGISGRMEEINMDQDFRVIVDFSHTPNALLNSLTNLKEETEGRLISVFGCAGERDKAKRPQMGKISAKIADISIITSEDPRTESVETIIDQIAKGCKMAKAKKIQKNGKVLLLKSSHYYLIIPDRRDAIKFAINLAQKGDLVSIFGKGHEKSMCFGNTEYPWSDQEEVIKAIENRLKNG